MKYPDELSQGREESPKLDINKTLTRVQPRINIS